jgi:hypothetical protein
MADAKRHVVDTRLPLVEFLLLAPYLDYVYTATKVTIEGVTDVTQKVRNKKAYTDVKKLPWRNALHAVACLHLSTADTPFQLSQDDAAKVPINGVSGCLKFEVVYDADTPKRWFRKDAKTESAALISRVLENFGTLKTLVQSNRVVVDVDCDPVADISDSAGKKTMKVPLLHALLLLLPIRPNYDAALKDIAHPYTIVGDLNFNRDTMQFGLEVTGDGPHTGHVAVDTSIQCDLEKVIAGYTPPPPNLTERVTTARSAAATAAATTPPTGTPSPVIKQANAAIEHARASATSTHQYIDKLSNTVLNKASKVALDHAYTEVSVALQAAEDASIAARVATDPAVAGNESTKAASAAQNASVANMRFKWTVDRIDTSTAVGAEEAAVGAEEAAVGAEEAAVGAASSGVASANASSATNDTRAAIDTANTAHATVAPPIATSVAEAQTASASAQAHPGYTPPLPNLTERLTTARSVAAAITPHTGTPSPVIKQANAAIKYARESATSTHQYIDKLSNTVLNNASKGALDHAYTKVSVALQAAEDASIAARVATDQAVAGNESKKAASAAQNASVANMEFKWTVDRIDTSTAEEAAVGAASSGGGKRGATVRKLRKPAKGGKTKPRVRLGV